ncbi:class I SAM-dependent methyltransferase [Nannocystis pusilla]|uniref:class I SAM-dependent methyltransferase n=1 Tax=Nannocystis pusilla TaxID=889268 RepID=UPI003BEF6C07
MTDTNTYALADAAHDAELARLRTIEADWDAKTRRHLQDLGLGPGHRCLEVGAGAGGVARWLSGQVGPGGKVVATDIDPRFLADLNADNIEVRRHDIAVDPLETDSYDLVHCRVLLIHMRDPAAVLQRMFAALRPGGAFLFEETTGRAGSGAPGWSGAAAFDRAEARYLAMLAAIGVRMTYGAHLPGLLLGLGAVDVGAEETAHLLRPGPQLALRLATVRALRPHAVASGSFTEAEIDEYCALLADPDLVAVNSPLISVWGRRP